MPLKLIPPKPGRSKVYRVRGTYHGVRLDRTTETSDRKTAARILKGWQDQIERGEITGRKELTFAAASASYLKAGHSARFMRPVVDHIGPRVEARNIDQAFVDEAAAAILPDATAATRNRQVYTVIVAVLRHAGVSTLIRRPKGALGQPRMLWLTPEKFEALAAAGAALDPELGTLLELLCYTGLRLSEALRLQCGDVNLGGATAFCGRTKNGHPRIVYLPPRIVVSLANHPHGLDREGRLFRWHKGGVLYALAAEAYTKAGVDHGGAPFHILRHSYGAWMKRIGADLVGTGAWRSRAAASVYEHIDVTAEAEKALQLPGATLKLVRSAGEVA